MADSSSWQFYLAAVVSAVSVLGWVGAFLAGCYAIYLTVTGGSPVEPAIWVLAAATVGAVAALVEKRIYRLEDT